MLETVSCQLAIGLASDADLIDMHAAVIAVMLECARELLTSMLFA